MKLLEVKCYIKRYLHCNQREEVEEKQMKHKRKDRMRKWMAVIGMACMLLTVVRVSSNVGIGTCGERVEGITEY